VEGDGYSAFVFVPDAQNGTVRKAPISVAFIDNNNVFINKGMEGITQVVTSGAPYLTESKKIRVIQ
jgi:hypothetical protein